MPQNLSPTPSGATPALGDTSRSLTIAPPPGPPHLGSDPAREHLQFVLGVLRRRSGFLFVFVAAVAALAAVVVGQLKPLYQAETQMVLEAPAGRSAPSALQALLGGAGGDLENETEAAILTSLTLGQRVITTLDLQNSPYFRGAPTGPSAVEQSWDSALAWLRDRLPEEYRPYLTPAKPAAASSAIANQVYDRYFRNLTVRPGDRSRVIAIRFVADDPTLAAAVANTLAQTYITDQLVLRRQNAAQEAARLDQKVEELRGRVNEAQRRVEDFRTQHGILDANGGTVLQRQLIEYNQQLTAVQLRRAELDARAKQLQALSQGGGGADTSAAALESTNVQHLREQEATAARQVAELAALYRDDHPRLQQARAQLDDIHAKIAAETRRLVAAAGNQARLVQEQEATIKAKIDGLNREVEQQGSFESQLRLLELDLRTTAQLYETLLTQVRQARAVEESMDTSSVRIISPALVPDKAFFPNKPLLVGAAAIVATLIGILLAFVLEFLDVGFRSRQQIEMLTGLETVASIPKLPRLAQARRLSDMRRVLSRHPAFAEAVRYARVSLALRPDSMAPVRRILVTSALPNEGKTFTSRALAVTFALGGKQVITIDCDLRQPPRSWSRRNDTAVQPGLAEFLVGTAAVDAIIGVDPTTGLHHIGCGDTKALSDAPILLESNKMRQLLRALAEKFDMVILDTPPVRTFPDALVLQQEVDRVLFLVRWAKTRREVALDALKSLIQAGRLDPVVALTQLDEKRARRYEYGRPRPQNYPGEDPQRREAA
jgi:polysaccharide biosynthesis transport protein